MMFNEPVYHITVQKPPLNHKHHNAVAAVLVFDCSPEEVERVNEFIEKLKARGIVKSGHARSYNDQVTSAELYFP